MTTIITQYDDVDLSLIPADAEAVAAYVGGSWPNYSKAVAEFPKARHKSIAVNVEEDADILDIENGDAVPADAPVWFKRQKARGLELPGLYSSSSMIPEVVAELAKAGIKSDEYVLWIAHYTGVQPTYPFEQGAAAVQYTDTADNRSLDASACVEAFWGTKPSPPVVNKPMYDKFPDAEFEVDGKKVNERATVELYDSLRKLNEPTPTQDAELALARVQLYELAKRVVYVANHPKKDSKPTWNLYHRGYRYQQLIHRAGNWRFV